MLILSLLVSVMMCHVRNPVSTSTQPPEVVQYTQPNDSLSEFLFDPIPFETCSLNFTQETFRERGTYASCSPFSAVFDFWIITYFNMPNDDVFAYYDIPDEWRNETIYFQDFYKPPGRPDRMFRLHMAKRIFVSKTQKLRKEIEITAKQITIFDPIEVDFSKTTETRNIIENWAAREFTFPVKKFIDSDYSFIALEYLIASVVNLESKWDMGFNSSQTAKRPFYLPGRSSPIEVTTMIGKGWLKTGSLDAIDSDFVDLPFEGGESHMYIILPRDLNNTERLRDSFNKITVNNLSSGIRGHVEIELPRFIVEKTINVGETYQRMGTKSVTSAVGILQKVYVKVTEEGVGFRTACNVSPVGGARLNQDSFLSSKVFQVNHVFAYLILASGGEIVLSGLVNRPSWSKRTKQEC